MKRFWPTFLGIATFIAGEMIPSCTEPIDLTNDGMKPKLVVTCILTDTLIEENIHRVVSENRVVLQRTTPFFGGEFVVSIADAKVWINGELLPMMSPGLYAQADFCAIPGETYTLEIYYDMNGDGIEEYYTATTIVPQKCRLDSVALVPLMVHGDYYAFLNLYFPGSAGENYFGAKLNNEGDEKVFSTRILRYSLFQFDVFSKEEEYQSLMADWFISKEMSYDNETKYYLYAGDTLSVTLESLSKEYHRFIEVAKIELSPHTPLFSGPRSDVPSNITGGALGIFGSYTASRATVVLPQEGLPKRAER